MIGERLSRSDPRIDPAITELKEKIRQRYPNAHFEVFEGEDPAGTYLRAIVDVDDTGDVIDVVLDRLLDLQVEEQLSLYLVASRPVERTLEQLRAQCDRLSN